MKLVTLPGQYCIFPIRFGVFPSLSLTSIIKPYILGLRLDQYKSRYLNEMPTHYCSSSSLINANSRTKQLPPYMQCYRGKIILTLAINSTLLLLHDRPTCEFNRLANVQPSQNTFATHRFQLGKLLRDQGIWE